MTDEVCLVEVCALIHRLDNARGPDVGAQRGPPVGLSHRGLQQSQRRGGRRAVQERRGAAPSAAADVAAETDAALALAAELVAEERATEGKRRRLCSLVKQLSIGIVKN